MLFNNHLIFLVSFLCSFILAEQISPEITSQRKKLIILSSEIDDSNISKKITQIVSSSATQLNRYNVLDRSFLDKVISEQKMQHSGLIDQSQAIEIGKIAAANEALFIQINNFGQKGKPTKEELDQDEEKEPETGLFGWAIKSVVKAGIDKSLENVERYPNNIETIINGQVSVLDIETGESISSFTISAEYEGGTQNKSLNEALKLIRSQIDNNLKRLYKLSTEVLDVDGVEVMLLLGENMGVRQGTMFEILTLDQKKSIRGRDITISGKRVGIVEVESVGIDASNGRILRKWESINPGYQARELNNGLASWGASVNMQYPKNMRLRFSGNYNGYHRFGGALFGDIGYVQDSRDDLDLHFGAGLDFNYRLILSPVFTLGLLISFPVDLITRLDDDDHYVVSPAFSPRIGAQSEIMINSKFDLVIRTEYVLSTFQNKWTYSEEDSDSDESTTYNAIWNGADPKIDYSGFLITLGIRSINVN